MPPVLKTTDVGQDQAWLAKGVDLWLLRDNLKLSWEERVTQHQVMLGLIDELKQIGRENRAGSSSPSQTIGSKPR